LHFQPRGAHAIIPSLPVGQRQNSTLMPGHIFLWAKEQCVMKSPFVSTSVWHVSVGLLIFMYLEGYWSLCKETCLPRLSDTLEKMHSIAAHKRLTQAPTRQSTLRRPMPQTPGNIPRTRSCCYPIVLHYSLYYCWR
jgi:hypothetical protein